MFNDTTTDESLSIYSSPRKLICQSISEANAVKLSDTLTERGLTECLLETDEDHDEVDSSLPQTIPYEVADSILAWQDVAPNAQIVIPRRKRVPAHSADEAHVRRHRNDEIHKYQKKTVESLFTTASLWRLCVEPTTYRYIPNNGRYRLSKHDHKLDRDSKIARTIRSMEKLSPEQRHLQKEIQRELRQEFEIQQRLDRQAEQRHRLRVAEAKRMDGRGQPRPERGEHSAEEQYRMPVSVQRRHAKDTFFHKRVKTPVELPPINGPLLGRGVNENFIDTLTDRMHNLEEEMKKDQALLRKKQIEPTEEMVQDPSPHFVVKTRSEHVPTTITANHAPSSASKTSHYMDFSGLPLFSEPVTEDCLSVKPIANQSRHRYGTNNMDNMRALSENNNNNEGLATSRSMREEEAIKTVYIKYTTSKGDVVRIPKYSTSVPGHSSSAPPTADTDRALLLRRSNGTLVNGKTIKGGREAGAREYYITPNTGVPVSSTFKYTSRTGNPRKGGSTTGVFFQEEEPPVIVAEGLLSRGKDRGASENIQVTVTKRKKEKGVDGLQQGFAPSVAGKNCEMPQRT